VRRAFIGVAVAVFTVLAVAGPASAAPGQVTLEHFNGTQVFAEWYTNSASSTTITLAGVDQDKFQGLNELFVEQAVINLDADGNITGGTLLFAGEVSGFSFAIDHAHLASASMSASGVPAEFCILDANLNQTSCSPTTAIDVNVSWTGQGPITHDVLTQHSRTGGFSVTSTSNGTSRSAIASGTIAGGTFNTSDLAFAGLEKDKGGRITVCVGASC